MSIIRLCIGREGLFVALFLGVCVVGERRFFLYGVVGVNGVDSRRFRSLIGGGGVRGWR